MAKKGSLLPPEEKHTNCAFWISKARQAVWLEWELLTRKRKTIYLERYGWKARKKLDLPSTYTQEDG